MSIDGGVKMSKEWEPFELLAHVELAVKNLNEFLHDLLTKSTDKSDKRASLIGYWINDYVKYQKEQDNFDPRCLPRYERGNIVEAHFGYRVGSELGGRHYGVVLDIKNNWSSPVIVVIPLTSIKNDFNPNRFSIRLNNGLYDLVKGKFDLQLRNVQEELVELAKKNQEIQKKHEEGLIDSAAYAKSVGTMAKMIKKCQEHANSTKKTLDSMKKMKKGSILEVGQITTISKQRISNPKMQSDSLFGIKLSKEDIYNLDAKINELYLNDNSSK